MPQPTTNNLEGWGEEKKSFEPMLREWYWRIQENKSPVEDFIKDMSKRFYYFKSDLRKKDEEELIKLLCSNRDDSNDGLGFGGEAGVDGFNNGLEVANKLIKDYYKE